MSPQLTQGGYLTSKVGGGCLSELEHTHTNRVAEKNRRKFEITQRVVAVERVMYYKCIYIVIPCLLV